MLKEIYFKYYRHHETSIKFDCIQKRKFRSVAIRYNLRSSLAFFNLSQTLQNFEEGKCVFGKTILIYLQNFFLWSSETDLRPQERQMLGNSGKSFLKELSFTDSGSEF
jgi:hypothetical protein